MLHKVTKFLHNRKNDRDSGIGIVEVLVAVTIIVVSLLGSALAIGNALEAQSTTEARNRAVTEAQDRVSQTQLIPFYALGVTNDQLIADQASGGLGGSTEYNGETIVVFPDAKLPVEPYAEEAIGKNSLRIFTYVTTVRENTFDGTIQPFVGGKDLAPKRVTVVVQWDSARGNEEVVRSWVKYPTATECAPLAAIKNHISIQYAPEGCKNA